MREIYFLIIIGIHMKKVIFTLCTVLALSACGGSSSSSGGDTASASESSGSDVVESNLCIVTDSIISIANSDSCELTEDIISTYSLDRLSLDTTSEVSCNAEGRLVVGGFISNNGQSTLNELTIICAS
jgi:hypothetical protein